MKVSGRKTRRFIRNRDWPFILMVTVIIIIVLSGAYGIYRVIHWSEVERDIYCNSDYLTKIEMVEYCGAEFPEDAPQVYKRGDN